MGYQTVILDTSANITNELSQGIEEFVTVGVALIPLSFQILSFLVVFESSPQHVIYRAMLTGTTTVSTVELTSLVDQWIGVIVQSNKMIMDSNC